MCGGSNFREKGDAERSKVSTWRMDLVVGCGPATDWSAGANRGPGSFLRDFDSCELLKPGFLQLWSCIQ